MKNFLVNTKFVGTRLQEQLLLSPRTLFKFPAHTGSYPPPVAGDSDDLRPSSGLHGQKQLCIQNFSQIKYNMNKTFEISLWFPEMFMFSIVMFSPNSQAQLWIFVQTPHCPTSIRNPWPFFLEFNVGK